jgi:hypothetical protein
VSVSNRARLQRLAREQGSKAAAARALKVSASAVRRWLERGVPDAVKALLVRKTKRYYEPPKPKPPKRAQPKPRHRKPEQPKLAEYKKPPRRHAEYKQPSRHRPKPAAPIEIVLGFERGPDYVRERNKLRRILNREPTEDEIQRAIAELPPKKREILNFNDVMERARNRGVLDYAGFQKIAQRFQVPVHDVYNVFFGYPPSVGKLVA